MIAASAPFGRVIGPLRAAVVACSLAAATAFAEPEFKHGISYFGAFKYPPDFTHFDYVNPDAPKGGTLVLATATNFDSFTPLLGKGISAPGSNVIMSYMVYDGLFAYADDELGTFYGNIAESVKVADDFTWATIRVRPEARWHDGEPITAHDVKFTFDFILTNAWAGVKAAFAYIDSSEVHDDREITFHFRDIGGLNANVVISLGKVPILPAHYWRKHDITRTTLTPPIGSGPYRIADFEQTRFILFERVADYWGRDLAIHRGRHNFDFIRYDYYRDATVSREAFRKGLVDYRQESDPGFWATGYDIPAKEKGWLVMGRNNFKPYVGIISGLALNTRREHLKDVRVREALTLALDYDWYNRAINYNFYDRAESYFPGTFLAATELPGAGERVLLDAYRDELPPRLFTQRFALPHSSGFGRNRQALVRARALLREAGWEVRDGVLVNEHGEPFELAFLANTAGRQRTFLLYVNQLQRLGIESRIRLVETSQYVNLLRDFNFDVVATAYGIAFPPGVELIAYFHSRAAWTPQTRNLSGIELDSVDAMIRHVLNARTVEELTDASRALDRILLWHYYMIPLIGVEGPRVVYWNKFGRPERDAEFRTSFPDAWWYDPAKAARIEQGLAAGD